MQTAKVFMNGRSQAVRLPKEFRFQCDEVVVKRVGDAIMLFPKEYRATAVKEALDGLDPEFRLEREQPKEQQRRDCVG
jgi:antitoxin VapB